MSHLNNDRSEGFGESRDYTVFMVLQRVMCKSSKQSVRSWALCVCGTFLLGLLGNAHANEEYIGSSESLSSCGSPVPAKLSLAQDYDLYEGYRIHSVRHKSIDVFDLSDPKENNWFYRLFNSFHINTKSSAVKPQLLFSIGDRIDASQLAESERLLRSRDYLADARIQVDQVCDDGVALLVVTRDVWTTEPEVQLSRQGGETEHGFGLKEGNIGGSGAVFEVGYYKDSARSRVDYGFSSPHIFNSRLAFDLSFSETSDGQQSRFALERPFYSLNVPWATGGSIGEESEFEVIRHADAVVNEYKYQHQYRETYLGYAFRRNDKRAQRLSVGYSYHAHNFYETDGTQMSMPSSYTQSYPWLEYRFLENIYAVYTNLNLLHQTEDVSLGADLRVRLGYAGSAFDNQEDVVPYRLDYSDLLGIGAHHLVKLNAYLDGYYYPGGQGLGESVLGGEIGYFYLVGSKHRWYSSISYFNGRELSQHRELTVGGITGLRGYPLDYQRGSERYVVTLEKRYISNVHIFNLVRFGVVTYLDVGKAWGAGYTGSHQLVDVGIGLRFSSSKARVGTVVHVDLATPLVDKNDIDSFQLVLKGSRSL